MKKAKSSRLKASYWRYGYIALISKASCILRDSVQRLKASIRRKEDGRGIRAQRF